MKNERNENVIIKCILTDNSTWFIVSVSPRGFSNELRTVAFMERCNAERFVSDTRNDGKGYVITGEHARTLARYCTLDHVLNYWDISEQYSN